MTTWRVGLADSERASVVDAETAGGSDPTGTFAVRSTFNLVRHLSRRSSTWTWRSSSGIITSLIGPSGCGKSHIPCAAVNRINERLGYVRTTGTIEVLGHDIYAEDVELVQVRKQIGMVFQRPNPLPLVHPRQRAVRLPDPPRRGGP